jgi:hypothetical protein
MKILSGDLMQKGSERIFSSRQLKMRVYIRLAKIILLK